MNNTPIVKVLQGPLEPKASEIATIRGRSVTGTLPARRTDRM